MHLIPSGLTPHLSPPDVSWNIPVKEKIRKKYDEWWISGEQTCTAQGNVRAIGYDTLIWWIADAWKDITPEIIAQSFKACWITVGLDGSVVDQVKCFQSGRCCETGIEALRAVFRGEGIDEDVHSFQDVGNGESDYCTDGVSVEDDGRDSDVSVDDGGCDSDNSVDDGGRDSDVSVNDGGRTCS